MLRMIEEITDGNDADMQKSFYAVDGCNGGFHLFHNIMDILVIKLNFEHILHSPEKFNDDF
jgi:hypothetical protein